MSARTLLGALAASLLGATLGWSQDVLEPGLHRGVLDLEADGVASFSVEIPAGTVYLEVRLRCERADLDLYVTRTATAGEDDEESEASFSDAGEELVVWDWISDWSLKPGEYTVEVEYAYEELPEWEGEPLEEVEYELELKWISNEPQARLVPGESRHGVLDQGNGRFHLFAVDVPEDAPALRVDVQSPGDVDLFLRRGRSISRLLQASASAESNYGRETLLVTDQGFPRLRAGTWYLLVLDYGTLEEPPVPYELLLSFEAEAPASFRALPELAMERGRGPLARGLASVVEIFSPVGGFGGSGTLLHEDGLILTNAHVVANYGDQAVEEVIVALTLDPQWPAVELFRATVVRFDAERDLAILAVTEGFYGQPLPAGYRFPSVELGDSQALTLADELFLIGYPSVGGSGQRVTLTLSRGIVAGFQMDAFGRVIKTDASMAEGNSGGAALDASGRLVGVPTFIVERETDRLSYLVGVEALPKEWRTLVDSYDRSDTGAGFASSQSDSPR